MRSHGASRLIGGGVLFAALLPAQTNWTLRNNGAVPNARLEHAMAFDAARARTVLFGGISGTPVADTWEWDGSVNWTVRNPPVSPPARYAHAMAFDAARSRTVLFGGGTYSGAIVSYFGDTWEWDGTSWSQRNPAASPLPRFAHALAYDAARGRTVLFGGVTLTTPAVYFADTWEWDGNNWTQRSPSTSPSARANHAMAYDAARARVVLFGGYGPYLADTWEWDGSNWSNRTPAASPPARSGHALAYDAARGRTVLFGGNGGPMLSDTWEWDGASWSQRLPATHPQGSSENPMVYDSARARIVVFGGTMGTGLVAVTWEYGPVAPASFTTYGAGCPGSAGTPALTAAPFSLPWLGDLFRTRVDAVPSGSGAFFVTGLASTPPASLLSFGLVGCFGYVTTDTAVFAVASAGVAQWTITVPNSAVLIGTQLFQQALVLDALATGGAVVSNAGRMTAGSR